MLYDNVDDAEPSEVIEFDADSDRWGDIWSIFVPDLGPANFITCRPTGPSTRNAATASIGRARLIDPYAQALAGSFLPSRDGIVRPPKCVVVDDTFDWEGDRHLRRSLADTVIYEMHVRGFTRSASQRVRASGHVPGRDREDSLSESLGVTAVELMPVHEFPTNDCGRRSGRASELLGLRPAWRSFSPHRGYAVGREPGCQVVEFKEMVRALHQAGIEVILDVVFNHTAEGNEHGPDAQLQGAGKPGLLHARQRRQRRTATIPAAAIRSTAITRSSAR